MSMALVEAIASYNIYRIKESYLLNHKQDNRAWIIESLGDRYLPHWGDPNKLSGVVGIE
jgi:hypothetical protein